MVPYSHVAILHTVMLPYSIHPCSILDTYIVHVVRYQIYMSCCSHTQSDFANNEKFITLNIAHSDGNRVYLPENFVVQGVKINTPHYLAKLEELPAGESTFTVIVSQLDSLSTIHYTLRVCVCVCVCVFLNDAVFILGLLNL